MIDEVVTVTEDEAFENARRIARDEGILVEISAGDELSAALRWPAAARCAAR